MKTGLALLALLGVAPQPVPPIKTVFTQAGSIAANDPAFLARLRSGKVTIGEKATATDVVMRKLILFCAKDNPR